jgi:hypothetical protein
MHSPTVLVVFCTLFVIGCRAAAILNQTPPLCEPGIVEEMPTHIRKVCVALENSNQLSNALNAYIKNEAAGECIIEWPMLGLALILCCLFG